MQLSAKFWANEDYAMYIIIPFQIHSPCISNLANSISNKISCFAFLPKHHPRVAKRKEKKEPAINTDPSRHTKDFFPVE